MTPFQTPFRPVFLTLACALLLTTGCHKKNSGINPASLGPTASDINGPAPTATITADPAAINQGQSTILNWRTTNATSVTIDGIGQVNPNGTQNATPTILHQLPPHRQRRRRHHRGQRPRNRTRPRRPSPPAAAAPS